MIIYNEYMYQINKWKPNSNQTRDKFKAFPVPLLRAIYWYGYDNDLFIFWILCMDKPYKEKSPIKGMSAKSP